MIARGKLDWLLGRRGGARDIGETGTLAWAAAFAFVVACVLLLSWLHPPRL